MEKKTVAHAIVEVLKAAKQPMSVADITQTILHKKLYEFSAKEPKNVVRGTIERRCQGTTRKDSIEDKLFIKLPDGKFKLE